MSSPRVPEFEPNGFELDAPLFVISVAAQLAGMHAQTLRSYDREGLVSPGRTSGGGRRYSRRDIELLREVQKLSQDEGVNRAGIRRIIELEAQVDALKARMAELLDEVPGRRSECSCQCHRRPAPGCGALARCHHRHGRLAAAAAPPLISTAGVDRVGSQTKLPTPSSSCGSTIARRSIADADCRSLTAPQRTASSRNDPAPAIRQYTANGISVRVRKYLSRKRTARYAQMKEAVLPARI